MLTVLLPNRDGTGALYLMPSRSPPGSGCDRLRRLRIEPERHMAQARTGQTVLRLAGCDAFALVGSIPPAPAAPSATRACAPSAADATRSRGRQRR
jgi:hypothetical protein